MSADDEEQERSKETFFVVFLQSFRGSLKEKNVFGLQLFSSDQLFASLSQRRWAFGQLYEDSIINSNFKFNNKSVIWKRKKWNFIISQNMVRSAKIIFESKTTFLQFDNLLSWVLS